MKIAVFLGGASTEREVSLASGKAVAIALKEKGHEVLLIDPSVGAKILEIENILPEGIKGNIPLTDELNISQQNYIEAVNFISQKNIDLAFLTLHGKWGEDGLIQSLFEFKKIKYTGSKVLSSALTMDKALTKIVMQQNNILTAKWLTAKKDYEIEKIQKEIINKIGFPLVVKPNDQGSTVGLTIVKNENEIIDSINLALKFSDTALIEEFIPGRELTVSVVGGKVYPIIEIKPDGGFYDYTHKYTKGMTEYICPAEIDSNLADKIKIETEKLFNVCNCKGFARVDFRLNSDGKFYCLEINTIPGMTATSLVPKSAKAIGIEFADLCENICNITLSE